MSRGATTFKKHDKHESGKKKQKRSKKNKSKHCTVLEETLKLAEDLQIIFSRECVICMNPEKSYAITTCHHMCLCESCACNIQTILECLICRRKANGVRKIYF